MTDLDLEYRFSLTLYNGNAREKVFELHYEILLQRSRTALRNSITTQSCDNKRQCYNKNGGKQWVSFGTMGLRRGPTATTL